MNKFSKEEIKAIYYEAEARSENHDYEIIAQKVYRVLTGKTKFCKFQLYEKDLIACCFEVDNPFTLEENTYGEHEGLVRKLYN